MDECERDRVAAPVDLDAVVGGHPDGLPLGETYGLSGSGRSARRVEILELRASRLAERPVVEAFEQPGDGDRRTR